ncbi:sensor histidine kinase [Bacteroidota bacterium]
MKYSSQTLRRTIPLHLLFWIGVWFLFYYFLSYNSNDKEYVTWFSSLLLPLTMVITYFAVYFLLPKYLLSGKYGQFFLYTFYTLLASSYFIVLIIYGILIFVKKWDASNIPPMIKNFFFILILVYLIVGILSFIRILNHNSRTARKNEELQNKILNTQLQIKEQELKYLKMQIHPHFLFNTLNTIYGFAIKQSKDTPDLILKLSNLLDYILYQVNKPKVPLKEEVLHIKEYIELERIRFQDTLRVNFTADEISDEIHIAPMLLIPFVENAFKHGSISNGYLRIDIKVKVTNQTLDFRISNTVSDGTKISKENGIGLTNIYKRMDIHYKDNYELNTKIAGNEYQVTLRIFNLNIQADE